MVDSLVSGVGMAIMGCRPFTRGHGRIIEQGLERHGDGNFYLVLGSADKPVSERCPWDINQRMMMPRNVFGKRIKIIPIRDLGAEQGKNDWVDYVRAKLRAIGLKDPTDYYTGSRDDAEWYINRFYNEEFSPKCEGDAFKERFVNDEGVARKLHIIDRAGWYINGQEVSGTGVRTMIKMGNPEWKNYVHEENWEFIEKTFPEQYKVKD